MSDTYRPLQHSLAFQGPLKYTGIYVFFWILQLTGILEILRVVMLFLSQLVIYRLQIIKLYPINHGASFPVSHCHPDQMCHTPSNVYVFHQSFLERLPLSSSGFTSFNSSQQATPFFSIQFPYNKKSGFHLIGWLTRLMNERALYDIMEIKRHQRCS